MKFFSLFRKKQPQPQPPRNNANSRKAALLTKNNYRNRIAALLAKHPVNRQEQISKFLNLTNVSKLNNLIKFLNKAPPTNFNYRKAEILARHTANIQNQMSNILNGMKTVKNQNYMLRMFNKKPPTRVPRYVSNRI